MVAGFKEIVYGDLRFYIFDGVYEPAEDTFLLADNMDVNEDDIVLDMGTGCGILAVLSALKASYVVAIDINPYAVRCAKENARRNSVLSKIDFICGNLFGPLRNGLRFTLILFNPPYLPLEGKPKTWIEYAWAGGVNGRGVIDKFLVALPNHLVYGGRLLMIHSSLSDTEKTIKFLEERGFKVEIIDEIMLFFETITLIRAIKVQE